MVVDDEYDDDELYEDEYDEEDDFEEQETEEERIERERLFAKYPYIVAYGRFMKSFDPYILDQCRKAKRLNAPERTISFEYRTDKPTTVDDLKNEDLKSFLLSTVKNKKQN